MPLFFGTEEIGRVGMLPSAAADVKLQSKSVVPSASEQVVLPDEGFDALSSVMVGPVTAAIDSDIKPENIKDGINILGVIGTLTTGGDAPVLQSKSVVPTENSQSVTPDAGYDGLSKVDVGAVSPNYVGSGVTKKGAATITPSESQQKIAANQYLTGDQTIDAIPSDYIGSAVNFKVCRTGHGKPANSLGTEGDLYVDLG